MTEALIFENRGLHAEKRTDDSCYRIEARSSFLPSHICARINNKLNKKRNEKRNCYTMLQ